MLWVCSAGVAQANSLPRSHTAVVFSSSRLDSDQARAIELGAAAFHTKPNGYYDYQVVVRRILKSCADNASVESRVQT
jgi:hypothetical protein